MTDLPNVLLQILLLASMVISCMLVTVAYIMIGKKITLLDYQKLKGINGTNKIQSIANIRTQTMRVFVGITFIIISVLLWADAPMVVRQWVNRILFVALPLGYFIATCLDWRGEKEQFRMEVAKEQSENEAIAVKAGVDETARNSSLQSSLDSHKSMAEEAVSDLETAAKMVTGKDIPIPVVASVVPEHNSPVTEEQQATADIATMRARLVAAKLTLGLPARKDDSKETT